MDLETIVDILTESCIHLAKAKSKGLTNTLMSILQLKLCNANIHTYTSHFMKMQQKNNETLTACVHCFKTTA